MKVSTLRLLIREAIEQVFEAEIKYNVGDRVEIVSHKPLESNRRSYSQCSVVETLHSPRRHCPLAPRKIRMRDAALLCNWC